LLIKLPGLIGNYMINIL